MGMASQLIEKAKQLIGEDILGAINCFNEALDIAENEGDVPLQLKINLELCMCHRNLTNMKEGFSAAIKAATLSQQLSDQEGLVRAYNYMGIFCFYNGLYKRAMHYFYFGIAHLESIESVSLKASVFTNLGETALAIGEFDQSLEYLEKANILVREHGLVNYFTPILCNSGNVYLKKNDPAMAAQYFEEAFKYQSESKDELYSADLDFKVGLLNLQSGNRTLAYDYFMKAENRYRRLNNRFYLIDVLLKLTELEDLISVDEREAFVNEAKLLAMETMAQNKMAMIEYKLHEYALKKDDYKEALRHYKAYHEYSSKSDAKNLLTKLEIMSIELDFRFDIGGEFDVQDFANMDIFGDENVDEIIESLKKDLHYKAYTDDLTNLPNRRKINEKLTALTLPEPGKKHGFLLIDIDHFKLVNDSEGHLYGDRCLVRVAKVIKRWAEDHPSFAGRYGGEEFLCILENYNEKDILRFAEELRKRVEEDQITYRIESDVKRLTVSIGCAYFDQPQENIFKMVELADRSLYMAKMSGRNRIMIIT